VAVPDKSSQFISQLCKIQYKLGKNNMEHSDGLPEKADTLT